MKKETKGAFLLLVAALIWGSSFIVMKDTITFIPSNMILGIRFTLATIAMAIIFPKYIKQINKKALLQGAITGGCMYGGFIFQTCGLQSTTPAKNAFLTTIYCVFVPLFVWLLYRQKPDKYHLIAAMLSISGVGFVALNENFTMQQGDTLTLIGSALFALHMIAIKHFTKEMHPLTLTIIQFAFAAIFALIGTFLFEDITILSRITNNHIFQILYLSIFATAFTLCLQNIGQGMVSACNAAIILSLESVFGVLFSIAFYGEILTGKMWIGFILIFIAVITSETKLSFLKKGYRNEKSTT